MNEAPAFVELEIPLAAGNELRDGAASLVLLDETAVGFHECPRLLQEGRDEAVAVARYLVFVLVGHVDAYEFEVASDAVLAILHAI